MECNAYSNRSSNNNNEQHVGKKSTHSLAVPSITATIPCEHSSVAMGSRCEAGIERCKCVNAEQAWNQSCWKDEERPEAELLTDLSRNKKLDCVAAI